MAEQTAFGSLSTTDSTVAMATIDCAQVGVEVSGTWTGTITFEDRRGTTWENAQVFSVAGVGVAATTTANVIRRLDTGGTSEVRARFSTATSGAPFIQFAGMTAGMGGSGGGGGGGAATIADGADIAEGTTTDAGVITDTSGTVIGFLRGLVKLALSGVAAIGTKTSNGAVPGATNVGALAAIATAAAPSYTEGRMVANSTDLSGRTRVTTETQTVNVAGTTAGGAAFVGPSVPIGFVGTGATMRNATAAPSVNNTTGTDIIGIGPLLKGTTNYFNAQGDDSGNAKTIGIKTTNAAVPGANNAGVLPAIANAAAPSLTETFQVGLSMDLAGNLRTLTSASKAEDAGHVSSDVGVFSLAVRQDTQSALAGTTLDYIPFITDANGSLRGVSGGYTTVITATLTRPADTTAYTAGDEMTDTGGTIRTITGAARFSGGSGIIQGIYVSQTTLWTTKPAMEIWIYDTTSTPVTDNGAFAPTDGVTDTAIAVVPVVATYAGTVNQALDSGQISIPFLTVGSADLYFRVVIRNAAQDSANSGVSKFRFRILMD